MSVPAPPLRTAARRLAWINAGMAALGLAVAAVTAGLLPDVYPVHFAASGRPDRWAQGVGPEWFALPAVGAVLTASLTALGLRIPRLPPGALNLPRKEAFLRLTPAEQAPIVASISSAVLVLGLLLSAQVTAIQLAMFGSAVRGTVGPFVAVPIAGLVATLGTTVAMIARVGRAIRRATGAPSGTT